MQQTASAIRVIRPLLNDILLDKLADLDRDELTGNVHLIRELADRRLRALRNERHDYVLGIRYPDVGAKVLAIARHQMRQAHQAVDEPAEFAIGLPLYKALERNAERWKCFSPRSLICSRLRAAISFAVRTCWRNLRFHCYLTKSFHSTEASAYHNSQNHKVVDIGKLFTYR